MKSSRIETLDWLRGLMALSIMFYHLTYWIVCPLNISSPLGRLGIYGVSIFFVLSGLSMAIVYNNYIKTLRTTIYFFVRRIFRIWPLLWVVCLLDILPQIIKTGNYNWAKLFINITTLFGFIKPSSYIPTGAWSIGNEMVYYALTPLIFFLYNYKKYIGNIFLIICICIGLFFAFYLLDNNKNLDDQWNFYINPFNNLFLYVMGVAIYYNLKDFNVNSNFNITLLIFAVLLFCFLPFEGDFIKIVSGFGRIEFVVLSLIIVICFYKLKINFPEILSKSLEKLGIATYGVYLIHPIVYKFSNYLLDKIHCHQAFLLFSVTSIFTIVISIYSFRIFELRLIKIGKSLTINSSNNLTVVRETQD